MFVWFGSQQLQQNPSANFSFLCWIPKIYLWDSSRTLGRCIDSADSYRHTRHVPFSILFTIFFGSLSRSIGLRIATIEADTFHFSNWILEKLCGSKCLSVFTFCFSCFQPISSGFHISSEIIYIFSVLLCVQFQWFDVFFTVSHSSAVECLFLICCLCFCGISECYHISVSILISNFRMLWQYNVHANTLNASCVQCLCILKINSMRPPNSFLRRNNTQNVYGK